MTLSYEFKQRCETLAVEWRIKLGLRAFDPLLAALLLNMLHGKTLPPNEIVGVSEDVAALLLHQDDWSAGILCVKPLIILYNPRHAPTRYEADVMHELAHVLLEHPMTAFSAEGRITRNDRIEQEAIHLGGCLQIPRRGLLWAIQNQYTVAQTAQHFRSSEAMVHYRANVTGVVLLANR